MRRIAEILCIVVVAVSVLAHDYASAAAFMAAAVYAVVCEQRDKSK